MDLRQLRRSRTDRHLGGVAGGLGTALGIDPIVVRVVFVVLAFFGGAGLILYAGAWLLLPEEDDEHGLVPVDGRSRAALLCVVLGLCVIALIGVGHLRLPWPFWVAACLALLLLIQREYEVHLRWWAFIPHLTFSHHSRAEQPPAAEETAATMAATPTASADGGTTVTAPAPPPPPPGGSNPGGSDPWGTPRPRPAEPPAPRRPTKPGPILFWITLALVVLAEGVVGTVDVSGAQVVGPVYPAVALGVVALMLLLSAFWGRGGGLILLGLISTLALVTSTAAHDAGWDGGRPQRIHVGGAGPAGLIHPAYSFHTGKLTLDLTRASDLWQLEGRTLDLTGRVGQIDVYLPGNACPQVDATVAGPGRILQQGQVPSGTAIDSHGFGVRVDHLLNGPAECVYFNLDAHLGIGQIEIDRY